MVKTETFQKSFIKILLISILGFVVVFSGCISKNDYYCSEYVTVCHYESCSGWDYMCKVGWVCEDVCIEYKIKEIPKNETGKFMSTDCWCIRNITVYNTTTTTTIETTIELSCEEIAQIDYNMTNPSCYTAYNGECNCKDFTKRECIKWETNENSKRCIEYNYSIEEINDMYYNSEIEFVREYTERKKEVR